MGTFIEQTVFFFLIFLCIDLQFVLHHLFFGFEKAEFLLRLISISVDLRRDSVLIAHVEVDSDLARVLRLEPKPIHDVTFPLLVEVLRPDQFF